MASSKQDSKRKYLWTGLCALFIALAAYLLFNEYARHTMKALNCSSRTLDEMKKRVAEVSSLPVYTPAAGKPKHAVTFHFNFLTEVTGEVLMTMQSYKLEQLVYRGPLQKKISIEAGDELLTEGGADNFKFRFIKLGTNEICSWEQERGAQVWKPNAKVFFDFLPQRELDTETGVPIAYKVRVE
jgi:hypothetical protein